MKVYITKINHFKYKYLMEWTWEGNGYSDRFTSLKELNEYISGWDAEKVFTDK